MQEYYMHITIINAAAVFMALIAYDLLKAFTALVVLGANYLHRHYKRRRLIEDYEMWCNRD